MSSSGSPYGELPPTNEAAVALDVKDLHEHHSNKLVLALSIRHESFANGRKAHRSAERRHPYQTCGRQRAGHDLRVNVASRFADRAIRGPVLWSVPAR
jgi:hypothetical protein